MSSRRANGEGSIVLEPSLNHGQGGYRARLRLPDGTRWTATATLRRDVVAKLKAVQREIAAGQSVRDADRVEDFFRWWLDAVEARASRGEKSVNTSDNAAWAANHWIIPILGKRKLRDLRAEDVEAVLSKMAAAGLAYRTINRVRSYFAQALDQAQKRGKISWNPARVAEMPDTGPSKARRAMTPEQAQMLLEAAEGDRLEALYITGLLLGLRPGELTGLGWADIDFKAGALTVAKSMKRERGELRLGEPKARSGRAMTMPPLVAGALRARRNAQVAERLRSDEWTDTGLVFTTSAGGALDPQSVRRSFRALTNKAGLGQWTTVELRHSTASLLAAAGVPLHEIADLLGHTSIRMLDLHYRHQLAPAVSAHVATMDRLFCRA